MSGCTSICYLRYYHRRAVFGRLARSTHCNRSSDLEFLRAYTSVFTGFAGVIRLTPVVSIQYRLTTAARTIQRSANDHEARNDLTAIRFSVRFDGLSLYKRTPTGPDRRLVLTGYTLVQEDFADAERYITYNQLHKETSRNIWKTKKRSAWIPLYCSGPLFAGIRPPALRRGQFSIDYVF